MRFFVAGLILYGWMIARGEPSPTGPQWRSILLIALLIFVIDYGLLFWAEQRVPSGIAAVMMATIPTFMALSEIIFLRTQKLTIRLAVALLIGLAGVAVLMSHSLNLGGAADRHRRRRSAHHRIDQLVCCLCAHTHRASPTVQSHELRNADACRRHSVGFRISRIRRAQQLPPGNGLTRSVAVAALPDRRRFHHRIHCLPMADPPRIPNQSRDLRLRESGCGRTARISPGRRSSWPANGPWNSVRPDQRGSHHDDTSKKATGDTSSGRQGVTPENPVPLCFSFIVPTMPIV